MSPASDGKRGGTVLDWELFFAPYRPLGVRFARGFVGEGDAAEDVFQEAARAAFEQAAGGKAFASAEHARNYLFRTLRNLSVEVLSTLQGRVENALAKLRRRIGKEASGP